MWAVFWLILTVFNAFLYVDSPNWWNAIGALFCAVLFIIYFEEEFA